MKIHDVFFHARGHSQDKLREAIEALNEELFQCEKGSLSPSQLEAKIVYDTKGEPPGDERVHVYPQRNLKVEITSIETPKGAKNPHLISDGLAFTFNKTNYLLSKTYQEPR